MAEKRPDDFAGALANALRERNMTAADLSRHIQRDIPAFSPGNISHYLAGRSVPRAQLLGLISQVLETDFQDYVIAERRTGRPGPRGAVGAEGAARGAPMLSVSDAGDGKALVQINQVIDWPSALEILKLFRVGEAPPERPADETGD